MKARMKFSKIGTMKFLGHLDVMRYFQKAFRRCSLDLAYTKGFNPHQIISFASPLGVGLTSDGEYLDVTIDSLRPFSSEGDEKECSTEDWISRINQSLNGEIIITAFQLIAEDSKPSMSLLAAADYLVEVKDGYHVCENFKQELLAFLAQEEISIVKKTKKSEIEMNIKPFIYKVSDHFETFSDQEGPYPELLVEKYENGIEIYVQLTAGSITNLKPELLIDAFCRFKEIPFNPFAYQIHRLEMYADVNAKKGELHSNEERELRHLVPFYQLT